MVSPYKDRPKTSYWKTGVLEASHFHSQLYSKKFDIVRDMRVATAGSCFAQHIGRSLIEHNYRVIDVEPAPWGLSTETARRYGYGLYSARYGNIYTSRQLVQLMRECLEGIEPGEIVWSTGERHFDALRPSVEPEGLDSSQEVLIHRADHLRRVRALLEQVDLLIFTLGLTEAWRHRETGTVFPTAPETVAGTYSDRVYEFVNFGFDDVRGDLRLIRSMLKEINPAAKLLLTVSPVPLTATGSTHHVHVASTYSKAVLRAAAASLYEEFDDVDYFPSFDMIWNPFLKHSFYDANLRSVTTEGVEAAMAMFFAAHDTAGRTRSNAPVAFGSSRSEEDIVCDEALLEAFAP